MSKAASEIITFSILVIKEYNLKTGNDWNQIFMQLLSNPFKIFIKTIKHLSKTEIKITIYNSFKLKSVLLTL